MNPAPGLFSTGVVCADEVVSAVSVEMRRTIPSCGSPFFHAFTIDRTFAERPAVFARFAASVTLIVLVLEK
jgi:hypothetical protein